ncbi:acyltransferase [Streptosporangium longisporum]|uniref:Acyltransferase n=1 Tax=Streptosporangium longisporum TaxID=46187 RepID=A0ABP6LAX5_9ACTN
MVATDGLNGVGTGSGKRIPRLEGLRGLLAAGVLVYHVAFMAGITSFIQQPGDGVWGVLTDGLGVMLPPFFVLSGMFLYRPFARATLAEGDRPAVGHFLLRRALRILPLYWLVAVVGLLTINFFNIDSVGDVLRPLLLVHFFWAAGQPMFGLEHTWTVPAEISFYLVLPILAWLGHRYARRTGDVARRARRMLLPVAGFALIGLAWVVYSRIPSLVASRVFSFEQYFWPLHFLHYFAGGMALAVASAYAEATSRQPSLHRLTARWPSLLWLVALVTYVVYGLKPFGAPVPGAWSGFVYEMSGIVAASIFSMAIVLLVTVANSGTRALDAVLGNRPLRYLGRVSYGIYLWHVLVIEYWFSNGALFGVPAVASVQWRGTVNFWVLLAFTAALTLLAATASYYLVERPLARLASRRSSGTESIAPSATVPTADAPGTAPAAPGTAPATGTTTGTDAPALADSGSGARR